MKGGSISDFCFFRENHFSEIKNLRVRTVEFPSFFP